MTKSRAKMMEFLFVIGSCSIVFCVRFLVVEVEQVFVDFDFDRTTELGTILATSFTAVKTGLSKRVSLACASL